MFFINGVTLLGIEIYTCILVIVTTMMMFQCRRANRASIVKPLVYIIQLASVSCYMYSIDRLRCNGYTRIVMFKCQHSLCSGSVSIRWLRIFQDKTSRQHRGPSQPPGARAPAEDGGYSCLLSARVRVNERRTDRSDIFFASFLMSSCWSLVTNPRL